MLKVNVMNRIYKQPMLFLDCKLYPDAILYTLLAQKHVIQWTIQMYHVQSPHEEGTLKEEQKGESPPGAERTIPGKGRRCVFLRFTKNLLFGTGCIVCDGSPTERRYCPILHCLLSS